MLRSILCILAGYAAACLAAGATQVLFVIEPGSALATPEAAASAALLIAMAATQAAVFALPFAILAIGLTETFGWRGWLTNLLSGTIIALCGYWTIIAGEEPGLTMRTDIALRAFAISGAVAGLVYWFVARGRITRRAS